MTAHLPRFLITGTAAAGEPVALGAGEAKHARVRRLGVGAPVALFDGAGRSYLGRLESLSREGAVVRVVEELPERDGESALELVLAIGALKADRFEWIAEKATELGVSRIQPFSSAHTLAQPSHNRQERWRQIALAAAKQSGRSAAPAIDSPIAFDAVLRMPAAVRLLFAEDGSGARLDAVAAGAAAATVLAIVGGEGGFSADELAAARAAGCHLISLGPRILRAETAALTVVALCQARWGDLGG